MGGDLGWAGLGPAYFKHIQHTRDPHPKEKWAMAHVYWLLGFEEANRQKAFPLPKIDELLDYLHVAWFFTKTDIHFHYHQMLGWQSDAGQTAFDTRYGAFE